MSMTGLSVRLAVACIFAGLMSGGALSLAQAQTDRSPTSTAEGTTEKNSQPSTTAPAQSQSKSQSAEESDPWKVLTTYISMTGWLVISTVLLVVGVGFLLYFAGRNPQHPLILQLGPSFVFWLSMGYTGLLLLMALAYNLTHETSDPPRLLAGILPVGVPWFGALGAVAISLEGVFDWNDAWKQKYNYWHIGRPLFGAVLGIVAFFIFVVTVSASGNVPPFLKNPKALNAPDFIIYYVLAFLVGYREETFRELIKRATDLILKPGAPKAPVPTVAFKVAGVIQPNITVPAVLATQPSRITVEVQNTSDAPLVKPTVTVSATAPAPAATFALANDQVTTGHDLAPGQSRTVDVIFTPPAVGPFSGGITVSGTNLPSPSMVPLSGAGQ